VTVRPRELALLLLLATLWGASFTFIKVGVETLPPLTLIAGRTSIAALILLAILGYRRIALPRRSQGVAPIPVSGVPQQRLPVHADRVGRAIDRCGPRDDPQFDVADLHVPPDVAHCRSAARHRPQLFGVVSGMIGICLIVGVGALSGLREQLIPELAIIAATICYAGAALFGRNFERLDPMLPAAGSMLAGAAVLIPASLLVDQPWTLEPSTRSIGALLGFRFSRAPSPSRSTSGCSVPSAPWVRLRRPIFASPSGSRSACCSWAKACADDVDRVDLRHCGCRRDDAAGEEALSGRARPQAHLRVYLPSNATVHSPFGPVDSQSWRTLPSGLADQVIRCFVIF
jgi:hypothetical protein